MSETERCDSCDNLLATHTDAPHGIAVQDDETGEVATLCPACYADMERAPDG